MKLPLLAFLLLMPCANVMAECWPELLGNPLREVWINPETHEKCEPTPIDEPDYSDLLNSAEDETDRQLKEQEEKILVQQDKKIREFDAAISSLTARIQELQGKFDALHSKIFMRVWSTRSPGDDAVSETVSLDTETYHSLAARIENLQIENLHKDRDIFKLDKRIRKLESCECLQNQGYPWSNGIRISSDQYQNSISTVLENPVLGKP